MTRLPPVSFVTMDRVLRRLGFTAVRQKGSHIFVTLTVVPRQCLTIQEETLFALCFVKSCGRLN